MLSGIEQNTEEVLDYDTVLASFKQVMDQLAEIYVNTMNTIHYMHDKYAYEAGQMALHDPHVHRYIAFGLAGLSIVADSLSAIKFAKVKPIATSRALPWPLRWRAASPGTEMTMNGWIRSPFRSMSTLWKLCAGILLTGTPDTPVPAHHHFQCGVRQEDRYHPRWPQEG